MRQIALRCWLLFLSFIILQVHAQTMINQTLSVIHNPHAPANFQVEVFVDRDPSGLITPSYRIGEYVRIGISVTQAAYVYLFSLNSAGSIVQVLPNLHDGHGQNNFLQPNIIKYFPPDNMGYSFVVDLPHGIDKVFVIASQEELTSSTLAGFRYEGDFAQSYQGEAAFVNQVLRSVEAIKQSGWVTDYASYQVVP